MKTKRLVLASFLGAALLFVSCWSAATQYCASSFRYHPVLGRRVIILGTPCFAPWAWLGWERRFQKRAPRVSLWEGAMRRIADGQMALPVFFDDVLKQLQDLVDNGRALGTLKVPGARPCVAPGCPGSLRRREGRYGAFWSCSRYPECRQTAREEGAHSESPKRVRTSRRPAPRSVADLSADRSAVTGRRIPATK